MARIQRPFDLVKDSDDRGSVVAEFTPEIIHRIRSALGG
jgi:hypothetical protein